MGIGNAQGAGRAITGRQRVPGAGWQLASGALAALVATTAAAGLTQEDVTGTGGFLGAYAGAANGANADPGFDAEASFVENNAEEQLFTGAGYASASANFSESTRTSSASGSAGLGFVNFTASAESTFDFSGRQTGGIAHGGWSDRITINADGLAGETAIWLFQVDAYAEFAASGFVGAPRIEIEPYVDNLRLPFNTPGFDWGGADPVATDIQHAEWGLVLPAIGASSTRTVNDTATFAAEIVIGQPFELGLYALGIAGTADNSAFQSIQSTADLQTGTVSWGGSAGLSVAGVPVASFTIESDSGTNWLPAIAVDDIDADGIVNGNDNCLVVANPGQQDTDGDQLGNAFDPDLAPKPHDCVVNFTDLGAIKAAFFSTPASPHWNADADFDSDDAVSFADLGTMKNFFFEQPGPGALPNGCP